MVLASGLEPRVDTHWKHNFRCGKTINREMAKPLFQYFLYEGLG